MNNVIVFIAPSVDATMRQKLAESLRICGIATTDNMQNATLVIANVERPVERMGIADFAEKIIAKYLQKVSILNREILLLNQKFHIDYEKMKNTLYILKFNYDVIFGQSYELVPMESSVVPEKFLMARDRLIKATEKKLQTR